MSDVSKTIIFDYRDIKTSKNRVEYMINGQSIYKGYIDGLKKIFEDYVVAIFAIESNRDENNVLPNSLNVESYIKKYKDEQLRMKMYEDAFVFFSKKDASKSANVLKQLFKLTMAEEYVDDYKFVDELLKIMDEYAFYFAEYDYYETNIKIGQYLADTDFKVHDYYDDLDRAYINICNVMDYKVDDIYE
jgi:hypothetical protein